VEFAISMFGMSYPPIVINEKFSPEFLTAVKRYPYSFVNYVQPSSNGALKYTPYKD
jgi:hypothetical protein